MPIRSDRAHPLRIPNSILSIPIGSLIEQFSFLSWNRSPFPPTSIYSREFCKILKEKEKENRGLWKFQCLLEGIHIRLTGELIDRD